MGEGMLAEGVEFMAIGMGTVFAFLALLVLAINCAGWVISTYFPAPVPASPSPKETAPVAELTEAEIAVALAAAMRLRQKGDG